MSFFFIFFIKHYNITFLSYQWYCHIDDDAYVNVPQLGKLLQKYDPHQTQYIGSKWRFKDPYAPVRDRLCLHCVYLFT